MIGSSSFIFFSVRGRFLCRSTRIDQLKNLSKIEVSSRRQKLKIFFFSISLRLEVKTKSRIFLHASFLRSVATKSDSTQLWDEGSWRKTKRSAKTGTNFEHRDSSFHVFSLIDELQLRQQRKQSLHWERWRCDFSSKYEEFTEFSHRQLHYMVKIYL